MEKVREVAPKSADAIERDFPEFAATIHTRLKVGAAQYGDGSFERPLSEIVREKRQEAEDIAGWGFILWSRLKQLERDIHMIEQACAAAVKMNAAVTEYSS